MQHKNHYAALDGLRGLAAVSVLLFHLGHWLGVAGLATNARLSVDLFFCLSGYVVPLAYQDRLNRGKSNGGMDRLRFWALRGVRLWPMIVAGTLISASYLLVRRFALHDLAIDLRQLGPAGVLSILCLPDFAAPKTIGGPNVFPLNGPQYTLFLELLANIAWAASPRLRGPRVAAAIVAVSFAMMAQYGPGNDMPATFWPGLARVAGTFYSGVLVFYALRNPAQPLAKFAMTLCRPATTAGLLVLTGVMFFWPTLLPVGLNWTWSLLVAPMLVLGGTGIVLARPVHRLALGLGELSYPLYVLHYPVFVWTNGLFQKAVGQKMPVIEAILILPVAIVVSMIVLRQFDQPVRAALGRALAAPSPRLPRTRTPPVET